MKGAGLSGSCSGRTRAAMPLQAMGLWSRAVAKLEDNSHVQYPDCASLHPDYMTDCPALCCRAAPLSPSRSTAACWAKRSADQTADSEFTVPGGMMDRDDIGHPLNVGKSFNSFLPMRTSCAIGWTGCCTVAVRDWSWATP